MSKSNQYDVIIVGAGPAGTSTALHLAQIAPELIPHTLILEKAVHPRPKLCGGGILQDGEVILSQLGLDITGLPHVDTSWAHFEFGGKGMAMRSRDDSAYAFRIVRRHEFDAWLVGKVKDKGFEIRQGVSVKNIVVNAGNVIVETDAGSFAARVVVGADGTNGVVRRSIVPREAPHTARLLEVVTPPSPQSPSIQSDSYFEFQVVPQGVQGYVWDFPAIEKGQPIRVRGIYDSNMDPSAQRVTLRDALSNEFERHGYNLNDFKLQGHPIRWFEADSVFSAPRVILAGDAAGADALFGEGISPALGYGALAAQAIQGAFAKNDFSFKDYRQRILQSELGKALRLRTWFARRVYNMRSPIIQSFLWQRVTLVLKWIVQTFLIDWAKREQQKATRRP